jgi:hypothetical protein
MDRDRSRGQLLLPPSVHHALKDFLTIGPRVMNVSFTQDTIFHSFVETGLIDGEIGAFPNGDKLMATIRRDITKD